MTADTSLLVLIAVLVSTLLWLKTSAPMIILVVMSSWLVSVSLGADILASTTVLSAPWMVFSVYLVLIVVPLVLTALHFRKGGNGGLFERASIAFVLTLLLIVIVRNVADLSVFSVPFLNAYFASLLIQNESIVVSIAFVAALYDVLNKQATLGIKAKKNRKKKHS